MTGVTLGVFQRPHLDRKSAVVHHVRRGRALPALHHEVEVAFLDNGRVAMRDSKDKGNGPALVFTPGEWAAFEGGVLDGEFKRP
ncbi:DUF397 domain-containing protein [Streptomyces sp. NPDC056835]|uniref:DUF397 domain-containing protein n=1 Tax=Streptomyces sp. NPDC056835 TaxID=3345956 RepID=UPI003681747E